MANLLQEPLGARPSIAKTSNQSRGGSMPRKGKSYDDDNRSLTAPMVAVVAEEEASPRATKMRALCSQRQGTEQPVELRPKLC